MKRFYSNNIQNNFILLENVEAEHCQKVLRCKVGDKVEVLNGHGLLYLGEITHLTKQYVQIAILQTLRHETINSNKLSIAICPTKNPARLEWFLEKATEIGVAHIFPIITERTEKQSIKMERLQQIIIAAAKQSAQLFFPYLHPIQSFSDLVKQPLPFQHYFMAHCDTTQQAMHLKNSYIKNETALLLIGPEGDFTSKEIEHALNKNYKPVSLGNSILRVETAGVYACSVIQMMNE